MVPDEDLIRWGWEEDVWFHVDKLSSAHVYLRASSYSWDGLPEALLQDLAQLVKANSIEGVLFAFCCGSRILIFHSAGNKQDNVSIVYTPWSNLKKTGDMATGQVGFHSTKLVKYTRVETRINEIVNRLNKTKQERSPDLAGEKDEHVRLQISARKEAQRAIDKAEREAVLERKRAAEARSYDRVYEKTSMKSNKEGAADDDFM